MKTPRNPAAEMIVQLTATNERITAEHDWLIEQKAKEIQANQDMITALEPVAEWE